MKYLKSLLWFFTICLPTSTDAQVNTSYKGIQWTEGLNWKNVLQKAKSENKHVFVDCYATWCGPCKKMDENVYPTQKVGEATNDKFICVKVQMDRTDKDKEQVKTWYEDARILGETYHIDAYPTLLFFSSDGSLIHRVTQGVNVEGFLDIVSIALDPERRYYSRLAEYQNGNKDTGAMKDLVKAALAANDGKMAEQIAEEYIGTLKVKNLDNKEIRDFIGQFNKSPKANQLAYSYINQLKENELYTKDNIGFIRQFTNTSKQIGFKIFYNNPQRINSIMEGITIPKGAVSKYNKGDYAQSTVRWIIYLEEIMQPVFKPAADDSLNRNDPAWTELSSNIQKKYPKTDAERIITDAKVRWYEWKEKWEEYSKSVIKQLEIKYRNQNLRGMAWDINSACWGLFERATDTIALNKAIYWMEEVFKQDEKGRMWGTALDTYANLLYKVGRTKEALEWEEKAISQEPQNQDIIQAWEKMNKGLPTWPSH
jgi:thiol-disulfide isomerase/thioredoxin